MNVTPHVAQNISGRRSALPDAIVAAPGYAISRSKKENASSKASAGPRRYAGPGSHGPWHQASRPGICTDHGCLQFDADALFGRNQSAGHVAQEKVGKPGFEIRKTDQSNAKNTY